MSSRFSASRNITERKRTEDAIRQMAFYDALTQLPNRRLLQDRIPQQIARPARTEPDRPPLHRPRQVQTDQRPVRSRGRRLAAASRSRAACAKACANRTRCRASAAMSLSRCSPTCKRRRCRRHGGKSATTAAPLCHRRWSAADHLIEHRHRASSGRRRQRRGTPSPCRRRDV